MKKSVMLSAMLFAVLALTACGNTAQESSSGGSMSSVSESSSGVDKTEVTTEVVTDATTATAIESSEAQTEAVTEGMKAGQVLTYNNVDIHTVVDSGSDNIVEIAMHLDGVTDVHQYVLCDNAGEPMSMVWVNDSDKYVVIDLYSPEKSAADEAIKAILAPNGYACNDITFGGSLEKVRNTELNYAYEMTEDVYNTKVTQQLWMDQNKAFPDFEDVKQSLGVRTKLSCSVTEKQDDHTPSVWQNETTFSGMDEWGSFSNAMIDKYGDSLDRNAELGRNRLFVLFFDENYNCVCTCDYICNAKDMDNGIIKDKLKVHPKDSGLFVIAIPCTTNQPI